MPLTSAEITFINKALDRHLATWRGWSVLRYFLLLYALLMFLMAYKISTLLPEIDQMLDLTSRLDAKPHILKGPSATRPVTEAEFLHFMESDAISGEIYGRSAAMMETIRLGGMLVITAMSIAGAFQIGYVMSRWNHHRRDAIFIKLLRETCRDELTPPAVN